MPLSQRRSRLVARLRRRKTRERDALVLVEGVRAARECLDSDAEVRFAVVSARLDSAPDGAALLSRLESARVEIERVADPELEALSDTEQPQGVLLVVREPAARPEALAARGRYLVLDGVQDPGNAGTLVRAAAAFGLHAVLALAGTTDLWGPKAVRASAGAVFRLPVLSLEAPAALAALRTLGLTLLLADAGGEDVRRVVPVDGGFALVVGNEGAGVGQAVRSAGARSVALAMPGGVESLNVAVAGSILLYLLTTEVGGGGR